VGLGDTHAHQVRLKMLPRKVSCTRCETHLVDVGFWISDKLGRDDSSRVAKAIRTRRERVRL
jgi:hypothetical protein